MIATVPDALVELPFPGSIGYLRGTGLRARVLRRNAPDAHGDRTVLVKLYSYERVRRPQAAGGRTHEFAWFERQDAGGNTTVPERDLYPTADAAFHCGRTARRGSR